MLNKVAWARGMIEIINRQRKFAVNVLQWEAFTERVLGVVRTVKGQGVTVAFVSDAAIRKLNLNFRGKDKTTDVLSFPVEPEDFETGDEPMLGDIIISLAQAARQAQENGLTLDEEIAQLILHGVLHLLGHDHETDDGTMNRLELRLRKKLGC